MFPFNVCFSMPSLHGFYLFYFLTPSLINIVPFLNLLINDFSCLMPAIQCLYLFYLLMPSLLYLSHAFTSMSLLSLCLLIDAFTLSLPPNVIYNYGKS